MSRIAPLLVAVMLLAAAGCSSDAGDTSETTQPAEATTAASDTTVAQSTTLAVETTAAPETTAAASDGLDIDPCALLTAAEITAATGTDFGEGTFNDSLSGSAQVVCDWLSSGSEFATAQILILNAGSDAFDSNMASAEDIFGLTTDPVDVPGADRSYATADGSIVAMDIGGLFVQVAYLATSSDSLLDATLEMATLAAGRMP